jgi:hypothetical protein
LLSLIRAQSTARAVTPMSAVMTFAAESVLATSGQRAAGWGRFTGERTDHRADILHCGLRLTPGDFVKMNSKNYLTRWYGVISLQRPRYQLLE